MSKTTVKVDRRGRLTLPTAVRRALHVQGEAFLEVDVANGTVVLRLLSNIPGEDAWAYTPRHVRQVERALREPEGRQMSEDDLLRLIAESEEHASLIE